LTRPTSKRLTGAAAGVSLKPDLRRAASERFGARLSSQTGWVNAPLPATSQASTRGHLLGGEPTPVFPAQVNEECQRLLESLGDGDLRTIAVWKTEGYTTEEIGAKLRRAPRTVERKLDLSRQRWTV
jgi:ECF sigma factor